MKLLTQNQQQEIKTYFGTLGRKIYSQAAIEGILTTKWNQWHLPRNISMSELLEHLINDLELKEVRVTSPNYNKKYVRYAWKEIPIYQLSLSLRPRSYLSHHSAMFLNDLTELISKTIYVNSEQSPKFRDDAVLEQRSIDLAFKSKLRTSKYIFTHKEWRICCLSGSNTNNLGVVEVETLNNGKLQVTGIERTLIDIAVRPFYSGGTGEVQNAYIKARGKISADRLISVLRKIDYVYPYHQVVGFYMQQAGFEHSALSSLKKMGLKYDFYLDYGMRQTDYSKEWRVYFPRNLRTRS
jgi:predicted transcriptional regulator of viral defense system